jgi:hypothetical protein
MKTNSPTPRRGFTVVELLVAMALIILIMAVLSQAFVSGLGAFRSLKGLGDMQERMRNAAVALRKDLMAGHFEGYRKLSDFDPYWYDPAIGIGDPTTQSVGGRPAAGFFRIQTPAIAPPAGGLPPALNTAATSVSWEGNDPGDNLPTFVMNPNSLPVLHLAVKLVPDRKDVLRRDQLFTMPIPASVPATNPATSPLDLYEGPVDFRQPGLFNSPWAEVAWFLVPNQGETAGGGVAPLYSLYRRQRLLIAPRRDTFLSTAPATPPNTGGGGIPWTNIGPYYGLSVEPDPTQNLLLFNSEYSVAQPPVVGRAVSRSMMYQPTQGGVPTNLTSLAQWYSAPYAVGTTPVPTGATPEPVTLLGDDLVTTDVLSFEIKVLRKGTPDFRDLNDYFFDSRGNAIQPYGGIYDTATSPVGWLGLSAIKITIRVWDFKTQQARQITVIQDL